MLLKRSKSGDDYYTVLGVSRDADAAAIKKAYKQQASILSVCCHPLPGIPTGAPYLLVVRGLGDDGRLHRNTPEKSTTEQTCHRKVGQSSVLICSTPFHSALG